MRYSSSIFLLFFFLLASGAQAQDVYVGNKPFQGKVSRMASGVWLELEPLADALGWTLEGDVTNGFALYNGETLSPPGAGRVALPGGEVDYREEGVVLVPLRELAELIGAKVIDSPELGTIDVAMARSKGAVKGQTVGIGYAPYTLIEFSDPSTQLCKDIQPAVKAVKDKYSNMQHILCDVRKNADLARYKKYKPTKDESYPEVVLLNSNEEVLFTLRGNHVIAKELTGKCKSNIKR